MQSKFEIPLGRGGGQVVSVLALYSDDPSSNPADVYSYSVKFVFEKNENKQKDAGVGPLFKTKTRATVLDYALLKMSSHPKPSWYLIQLSIV